MHYQTTGFSVFLEVLTLFLWAIVSALHAFVSCSIVIFLSLCMFMFYCVAQIRDDELMTMTDY